MDLVPVVICGKKLWGVRQVFVGYNNDVSNSINNVNDTIGDEKNGYNTTRTINQQLSYKLRAL